MSTSILKEGVKAPELNILGTDDKIHKIGVYATKKLILFFYPKDNTLGELMKRCLLKITLVFWKNIIM